jgi:hypothetical protein
MDQDAAPPDGLAAIEDQHLVELDASFGCLFVEFVNDGELDRRCRREGFAFQVADALVRGEIDDFVAYYAIDARRDCRLGEPRISRGVPPPAVRPPKPPAERDIEQAGASRRDYGALYG